MRGAVVGLLVATAFILSGCQYLLGGMMGGPVLLPGQSFDPGMFGSFDPGDFGSFDPNEPLFSFPPPLSTYTKGSASVTIDGKTTAMDSLNGRAARYQDLGAEVGWTDGAGLFVRFYGEPGSPDGDGAGILILDRIVDNKHWTTGDFSRCKVSVSESADKTLSGTAACKGVRWADTMSSAYGPGNVDGQAPFDVMVTFEAKP
ncbi:MAG: hypothetical protein ACJ77I_08970 [Chloroflexota bacterium]